MKKYKTRRLKDGDLFYDVILISFRDWSRKGRMRLRPKPGQGLPAMCVQSNDAIREQYPEGSEFLAQRVKVVIGERILLRTYSQSNTPNPIHLTFMGIETPSE